MYNKFFFKRWFFGLGLLLLCYAQPGFSSFNDLSHKNSFELTTITNTSYTESATFATAQRQLEIARKDNQLAKQDYQLRMGFRDNFLQHKHDLKNQDDITTEEYRSSHFALLNARGDVQEAKLQYAEAMRLAQLSKQRIQYLKEQQQAFSVLSHLSNYVAQKVNTIKDQIKFEEGILRLTQARIDVLTESFEIAQHHLKLEEDFYKLVQERYVIQKNEKEYTKLEQMIQGLQKEQEHWIALANQRQMQLQTVLATPQNFDENLNFKHTKLKQQLEIGIFEARERSNFYEQEISITRLNYDYNRIVNRVAAETSVTTLRELLRKTESLEEQALSLQNVLTQKINFLENDFTPYSNFVAPKFYEQIYTELDTKIKKQRSDVTTLRKRISEQRQQIDKKIKENISKRHELPGFSSIEWQHLSSDLVFIPTFAWYALDSLIDDLVTRVKLFGFWLWIDLLLLLTLWSVSTYWLKQKLLQFNQQYLQTKTNILKNIGFILVKYFLHYFIFYSLISSLLLGLAFVSFHVALIKPVLICTLIFFLFSFVLYLARIFLVEATLHKKGQDVRLYKRLKMLGLSSALLTVLTLLVEQLPVSDILQDIFDRLFMLTILCFSIWILRGWRTIPNIIAPYLNQKFFPVKRAIEFLSVSIPVFLIITSLIGVFGYISLAWQIMKYMGIFLAIFAIYFILRRVTLDFTQWLAYQLIRQTKNGWFWSEALLKPIAWILELTLFAGTIIVLLIVYEWSEHTILIPKVLQHLYSPFIDVAGSSIHTISVIKLLFIIALFYWITRWMRELSYRWLYVRVEDLGLRNTLSIFSQYTVVIVGFFVALNFLNIELENFALLASALAVGIGFGLRNLANDFVCGFLLLIERPVRKGDLVSISGVEGQVMHIGMRAMTLQTWDHMEVIVPNSETFSKTFTNWTHQDSIVRSVFTVRISRQDNPRTVEKIILNTLLSLPDVLATPAPEVFFKEIEQCLIEFQVGFYINMAKHHSRLEVRSLVLFTLWECFAEFGIHPPYPSQEVFIKQHEELCFNTQK